MYKIKWTLITLIIGLASFSCYASPITPSVPNVAGATLSDIPLLGEANGQTNFAIPSPTPLQNGYHQNFNDSLTSVFGDISTDIANKIFSSASGQSGEIPSGNDTIYYQNINGTITVTITNNISGESTTLTPGI